VVVWKQLSSTFAPILNIFFNANAFYPSSFETCQHAIMRVPRLYFSPTLCSSTGHSTMFASKIHTKIRTSSKNVFSSALSLHELCRPSKNHKKFLPNQDPAEPEICTISGASTLGGPGLLTSQNSRRKRQCQLHQLHEFKIANVYYTTASK
jgi:hypothetical protein